MHQEEFRLRLILACFDAAEESVRKYAGFWDVRAGWFCGVDVGFRGGKQWITEDLDRLAQEGILIKGTEEDNYRLSTSGNLYKLAEGAVRPTTPQLIIEYCETGEALSDFNVERRVAYWQQQAELKGIHYQTISTFHTYKVMACLVARGDLKPFRFIDKTLDLDAILEQDTALTLQRYYVGQTGIHL